MACTCTDQRDCPHWRPASNGSGKMRWGAARYAGREWAKSRVASFEAAQRLANRLNLDPNDHNR